MLRCCCNGENGKPSIGLTSGDRNALPLLPEKLAESGVDGRLSDSPDSLPSDPVLPPTLPEDTPGLKPDFEDDELLFTFCSSNPSWLLQNF